MDYSSPFFRVQGSRFRVEKPDIPVSNSNFQSTIVNP